MDKDKFLVDIQDYINKSININSSKNNILTCQNCFDNSDQYKQEKEIFKNIKSGNFKNTKEQGDLLENLVKSLFK